MYDTNFFIISWVVFYLVVSPILFFAIIGIVYEAISDASPKSKKPLSMDKLLEKSLNNKLELKELEKLIDEFIKYYIDFDGAKDIDKRFEFIKNIALNDEYEIESANALKERILMSNPKTKKDIEKSFSQAFKDKDKAKKKKR